MRRSLLAAGTLAVLLGSAAGPASAAFCVARSKIVVFRPKGCKPKETALDAVQIGAAGSLGDKGESGDIGGPALLDGAGHRIGTAWIVETSDVVFITSPVDGKVLGLLVSTAGFTPDAAFYYEMPNCLGEGHAFEPAGLVPFAGYLNGTIYYMGDVVDQTPRQIQSYEQYSPICPGQRTDRGLCCNTIAFTAPFGPTLSFDATAAFGPPPFKMVP